MDPVLIEVPERIETERLILRCPRPGDGPTVNEAERELFALLDPARRRQLFELLRALRA